MNGMDALQPFLARLADGATLGEDESAAAFEVIMSGGATPAQIGAFLMGLRQRGETVEEITGAARIMRAKALPLTAPANAIDTCGTGGDGAATLNISTAAAIVVAAAGVPVAKHGNRALSSRSGSADVLRALGVNIEADTATMERALNETGLAFMMAPLHHAAMRHVGPVRVEMGIRTIFNLLGPLANPAGVRRQVVGVFARQWIVPLATVLGNLGAERAWVVHGSDGLDELTTTGPTYVAEWRDGVVREFSVRPADAGLTTAKPEDLRGGTPDENAAALSALLDGATGPYRDAVLLAAAAALVVAGKVNDLKSGVGLAAVAIDERKARTVLTRLCAITSGEA
ncbi:MAG: anthranilate phosphoribosyltransferase [Alphaproteobacteria bacterium]